MARDGYDLMCKENEFGKYQFIVMNKNILVVNLKKNISIPDLGC